MGQRRHSARDGEKDRDRGRFRKFAETRVSRTAVSRSSSACLRAALVVTDARLGACCARETTRWPVKVRDWVRAAMVTVFLGMTLRIRSGSSSFPECQLATKCFSPLSVGHWLVSATQSRPPLESRKSQKKDAKDEADVKPPRGGRPRRGAEEDAAAPLRLLRDDVDARLCASPRIRVVREEPARARPPDPTPPLSNFGLTPSRRPLPSETQQNARKQHNLGFKHLANVRNYYSQFQAQVDARDAPPVETSPAVAYQMQVSRVLQQQQMPPPGYGGYPPPTGMAPMGAPMGMAPMGMQAMGAPMGMQPIGRAPMGQGHPPGPPPR